MIEVKNWIKKIADIIMPLEVDEYEEESKNLDNQTDNSHSKREQYSSAGDRSNEYTSQVNQKERNVDSNIEKLIDFNGYKAQVTSAEDVRYTDNRSAKSVYPRNKEINKEFSIKVQYPENYDDVCKAIVDALLKGSAVIVNFKRVDESIQQRIDDFVVGAVSMINGREVQISKKLSLYIPAHVKYNDILNRASSKKIYSQAFK